jgi:hypothetical protein
MNWKGFGRTLLYLPGDEGNHANLCQDSRLSGRDSNREFPEYKSRAVPLDQPVRSKHASYHFSMSLT